MNLLRKLPKNKCEISRKYFVLDIETRYFEATPEAFLFACLYGRKSCIFLYSVQEVKDELKKLKYKNKYIFAHNGGKFDFPCIFGNLIEFDNTAIFNESNFICCKYGKVKLVDSLNILKTSVEQLGKFLGQEKLDNEKLFKEFEKGIITEQAKEYCKIDCKIVWDSLNIVFTKIGAVKITLASCSLHYFRTQFQEDNIFFNDLSYEFKNSYYGGRVECFKIGKTYARKYDINSLYPFCMLQKIPNPSKLHEVNPELFEHFLNPKFNYGGLIECEVEHYENNFGFLPLRKNGKLIFPMGKFSGTWNINEIQFALKNKAIKILSCKKLIVADLIDSVFTDFVIDNYRLRVLSKGTFLEYVYKIILNSLYGKFAQRTKGKQEYFPLIPDDYILRLDRMKIPFEVKMFSMERNDCYIITKKKDEKEFMSHSIPLLSSYVTSYGRIELLKLFIKHKENKIVYCDTDSIACEIDLEKIHIGKELGELKEEKEIIINIRGNKNYTEINDKNIESEKIKGIPKKNIEKNLSPEGNLIYKFSKLAGSKEGLRRNIETGTTVNVTKILSKKYDKRKFRGENESTEILIEK